MLALAARRLLTGVPTLLAIIVASFFLMRSAPGGPFDGERPLAPEVRVALAARYDLDAPLIHQLGRYLGGLARGDFGPSLVYRDFSVTELIAAGLPVSLTLGGLALVVALGVGVPLGALAAWRCGSRIDRVVQALTLGGVVAPTYVTAPLLVLVFGLGLKLLPVSGWEQGRVSDLILPVVALSMPVLAIVARLARGAMLDTLGQDFIRTARSKGLAPATILRRHALRPALLPVVSYIGPAAAGLLTGSVIVETVFTLPGLGRYFVQGALNRDYPLVMGVVILYAALVILFNLLADLAYGWLDSSGAAMTRPLLALLVLVGLSLLVPCLSPWPYDMIDWDAIRAGPFSHGHLLGTDGAGRDLLVRSFVGLRLTLSVGFAAALVSLVIGVAYGAIAGLVGGRVDDAMMRSVDILYALPFMFLVIVLMVVFGRSILLVFLAIGAVERLTMARIVRGQTIALKNRGFVLAAEAAGAGRWRILYRHILPNLAGIVLVYLTLTVPQVVLVESFLSFLGLGVQEPLTSLGILIKEGADEMEMAPWGLLVPGALLVGTLLALNLFGERLRDRVMA